MIDEQFLGTIPQYGIGGFVGKIFKQVKQAVKKVAPIIGGGIGFMIAGPVGAGIGSGIGGLVAGQDPSQALQTAMLGYGIGSLAGAGAFGSGIAGRSGVGFGAGASAATPGKFATSWGQKYNLFQPSTWGTPKLTETQKLANIDKMVLEKGLSPTAAQTAKDSILLGTDVASTTAAGKLPGSKYLGAAALAAGPLAYMMASNQEEEAIDPYRLNPFYYQNPEEFQLANIADSPYYYSTLQDEAGYPIEDLPTDFVRSAEGGIIQLAGGTRERFPRRTGPINGSGTGTSDSIPAMLSDGEFVMTAEAVRNAGGGSRRQGAKKMYNMMKNLERRTA